MKKGKRKRMDMPHEMMLRRCSSELVANYAEEGVARLLVFLRLHTLGLCTVDDAHHAAALSARRDNDLERVRCGTEDVADLRDCLDRVEDVDRERVLHEDPEGVATAGREGVLLGELDALLVVALGAHQARTRRLAEGEAKLDRSAAAHTRLVEVMRGLDEVGLPEDEVQLVRVLDLDKGSIKCGHSGDTKIKHVSHKVSHSDNLQSVSVCKPLTWRFFRIIFGVLFVMVFFFLSEFDAHD